MVVIITCDVLSNFIQILFIIYIVVIGEPCMFIFAKVEQKFRILIMTFVSIVVFTIIYWFCDNEEFITWIGSYYQSPTESIMYLTDLFNKLHKGEPERGDMKKEKKVINGKHSITRKTFVDIPIYKDHDDKVIYILPEHNERTMTDKAITMRKNIFDLLNNSSNDDKGFMSRSIFVGLPLNMKYIGNYVSPYKQKLNYTNIAANKNYKFSLLDRLYFSTITQATIGFGDVVPASKRVRVLATLQALSTLLIVALH